MRFFMIELERLLDEARQSIVKLIGGDPASLGFVPNSTIGVASILHSLNLKPGDEIVVNSHEYMSAINELSRLEKTRGIKVHLATVPFPIAGPDEAYEAVMKHVSATTKLVIVSHITSPTALIMPIERIVESCGSLGVLTLIDGAHAPGQIQLDVEAIGASYYVGNFHKWVSSPRGAGFIYTHDKTIEPLALSSRAHYDRNDRDAFRCLFDYVGTNDYSAVLSVAESIAFHEDLVPGGFPAIMEQNHALVLRGREVVCQALNTEPAAPDSMIACMASFVLCEAGAGQDDAEYEDSLQDALVREYGVQVPVMQIQSPPARFLRISAHLYNSIEQYEYLARALGELIK